MRRKVKIILSAMFIVFCLIALPFATNAKDFTAKNLTENTIFSSINSQLLENITL